ncbi:MAG: hypothetical protein Q8K20_02115 [Gemmobacter sp.]|nr:hypothetical protein [Gemmobacter sp.]
MRLSPGDLADAARPILDGLQAGLVQEAHALFSARENDGRATTQVARAARAATFGAVEILLVDIDEVLPGTVDDATGDVTFAKEDSAQTYGVVDEIAARVLQSGGRVMAVRRDEIPQAASLAAILRYAV